MKQREQIRAYKLLTTFELGELLGVTKRTIINYVKEGLPKEGRNCYDPCKVLTWYADRTREQRLNERRTRTAESHKIKLERRQEQARRTKAQADYLEVKLKKAQGLLIDREQATMIYGKFFYDLRGETRTIPRRIEYDMRNKTPEQIRDLIVKEIDSIFTRFDPLIFWEKVKGEQ